VVVVVEEKKEDLIAVELRDAAKAKDASAVNCPNRRFVKIVLTQSSRIVEYHVADAIVTLKITKDIFVTTFVHFIAINLPMNGCDTVL
jgi:hypothetical protein